MAKKNIPYDQKYYDPEIECMPRPELEQMQLERLQEMVQYAYDNTVYYKRSFDEAGVAPSDIKTLRTWRSSLSSIRKPSARPSMWERFSARCARCPRRTSSSWPPRLAPRAFPR